MTTNDDLARLGAARIEAKKAIRYASLHRRWPEDLSDDARRVLLSTPEGQRWSERIERSAQRRESPLYSWGALGRKLGLGKR